jgi:hypothetical protein
MEAACRSMGARPCCLTGECRSTTLRT